MNISGILGFALARLLGRDFVDRMIPSRFSAMQQRIEHSGFSVVLYLRLIFVPVLAGDLHRRAQQHTVARLRRQRLSARFPPFSPRRF